MVKHQLYILLPFLFLMGQEITVPHLPSSKAERRLRELRLLATDHSNQDMQNPNNPNGLDIKFWETQLKIYVNTIRAL